MRSDAKESVSFYSAFVCCYAGGWMVVRGAGFVPVRFARVPIVMATRLAINRMLASFA